ncbi:MAG: hypothetical protein ABI430_01335 [Candidatus Taylorbacteria bacterium]
MNPLKQKIEPRLNLSGFTPEEREELIATVLNIVQDKIFIKVLDELSHEEKAELEKMTEGEYKDKLRSFLQIALPQFQKIIDDCADEVIGEFNALRA